MEAQPAAEHTNSWGMPPSKRLRNAKRKQLHHSADIVFTRGATLQTMAPLTKLLKGVTEPVIGLQYVWEYRSPSKSVPPHYQCKLCAVTRLQHDMLAHVRGWKHSFRYLKKIHPDKATCEEEDAIKDPAMRKQIKENAAEVEKTEGRGQLKVIQKEPCDVLAFKGLRSAIPKAMPPAGPGMGLKGTYYGRGEEDISSLPFPRSLRLEEGNHHPGGRYSDSGFPGEYPPQGGSYFDYPVREFEEPGTGDYSTRQSFHGSDMDLRPLSDGAGHHQAGGGDGYGRSGLLDESPGRSYSNEFGGSQMDQPMDRPTDRPGLMGPAPESSNLPTTLLSYLDTFRIENESDAQIVLKVTQKLTDVLMDYRLRSVSSGSSLSTTMNNSSLTSMNYSPPSRMPSAGDRYSGSLSGSSRYSGGPSRFYN